MKFKTSSHPSHEFMSCSEPCFLSNVKAPNPPDVKPPAMAATPAKSSTQYTLGMSIEFVTMQRIIKDTGIMANCMSRHSAVLKPALCPRENYR